MFIVCFLITYFILVLFFVFHWHSIPIFKADKAIAENTYLSVVIAARNEQKNIINILQSIENQSIGKKHFEIIVVDDFSTDNTFQLIETFTTNSKLNIRLVKNDIQGKKNAITKAIALAKGEIIVCTDADCIVSEKWLETIAAYFASTQAELVFGPVMIEASEANLFHQMQQIEFASLIGSGAASWHANMPNMCNGANLAYKKTAFTTVNGFEGNEGVASGDDEFLMHKIFEKSPDKVFFLKSSDAIVTTKPLNSLNDFFRQRLRWASKWEHYTDWKVQAVALYIFTVNLLQILSFFFLPLTISILMLVLRALIEYTFLNSILRFMYKRLNLIPYLLLVLIYPYYVVFFALAGRFKRSS